MSDNKQPEEKSKKWEYAAKIGAGIFLFLVLGAVSVSIYQHVQDIALLTGDELAACEPGIGCMKLNEWGDFFAGAGATLALIFISLGLYLQTKELEAQREAMGDARDEQTKQREEMILSREEQERSRKEQEKATLELVNSRIDDNLRTIHNIANEQLIIQPVLVFKELIISPNFNTGSKLVDRVILTITLSGKYSAIIRTVALNSTPRFTALNVGDYTLSQNKKSFDFEFDTVVGNLNLHTINYSFIIHYLDELGFLRAIGCQYSGSKLVKAQWPEDIAQLEGERFNSAEKLKGRNKELLGRNT